jgi:C-terminal processing protease CtpA/Prc
MKFGFLDDENVTMHLKLYAFSRKRSKAAYRKIFRKLKKNKTENLILDLRNNGGGSLENCYNLLSYLLDTSQTQTLRTSIRSYPYKQFTSLPVIFKLMRFGLGTISKKKIINDTDNFVYTIKPRKKNHYNNKIFVLINGGSFSASCLVAAYLKTNKKAVFIGEETAGAMEGCNAGITPYYTLPNTKAKIRMPAFRVVHDVCPTITGHGILPDYKIEYSIMDILNRKDLEIIKAKELIRLTK